ncbi:MAG: FAD-binding oxidoreductase [Campylobacteraceae bacterium]|nr:FAD-binding oxidoreductase [Campylobacteraceae bacterium]
MNSYDAIVIGGGIQGCSVAYNLADNNLKVLILEKDYCARHASGVNAGGVRRLGRDLRELGLADFSMREYWHKIDSFLDDDCEFVKTAQIKIAMNEEAMEFSKKRVEQVKAAGFEHEQLIDRATLKGILPNVSNQALGAILVEGDGHANPFKTTIALKQKAIKLGVHVRESEKVINITGSDALSWRVETIEGVYNAKYIINCAGAWGDKIAAFFSESLPFSVSCSLLSITSKMEQFLNYVIGFQGRTLSLKQFSNGSLMIGGGFKGYFDLDTNKTRVNFTQIAKNVSNANELFEKLRDVRILRSWGGIEGQCGDKIATISKSTRYETVFHNFGYSSHGFEPAFGSGKIVSQMVLDQN